MSAAHEAAPAPHPELANGEVHVWRASLDLPEPQVRHLGRFASRDERERAYRFRLARDRDRFLAGRGLLRLLLARYSGSDPDSLAFRYGPSGKPELAESSRGPALRFNTSHSRGLGLFAFTYGRRVGIDVEALRPVPEAERIAERFFSPRESAALRALPAAARPEGFLRRWTCKEAFLKASGEGLSGSLRGVEVELPGDGPARLILDAGRPGGSPWILQEIAPGPGYVGALVLESAGISRGAVRSSAARLRDVGAFDVPSGPTR